MKAKVKCELTFVISRAFRYLLESATDLLRRSSLPGLPQYVGRDEDVPLHEASEGPSTLGDRLISPQTCLKGRSEQGDRLAEMFCKLPTF